MCRPSLAKQVIPLRDARTLERWYQEWHGIVDSLLLFDLGLFSITNRPLLRRIFRKVLHIAMHNVDDVTKYWKEFSCFLWNNASKQHTLVDFQMSEYNPFSVLLGYGPIREIFEKGIRSKQEATSLAHLLSTRQMVPGSIGVQVKSLDKFVSTTSERFVPSPVNLARCSLHAGFVGKRCARLGKTKGLTALNHISLSTAGDVDVSKANGGRGVAVMESIREILSFSPLKSSTIELPFGFQVREEQGIARFCTWGRPSNLSIRKVEPSKDPRWKNRSVQQTADQLHFGETRNDFNPDLEGREKESRVGYDEYLGIQIFYCALFVAFNEGYIDLEGNPLKPIPASTSVVPEPGGKARVVTTTKWWVQVLEQPFGHLTKALLSAHPSAESGLIRADQAWLYLNLLSKVEKIPDAYVLSSDLEEATDAIDPLVAAEMVSAFYHKIYGFVPKIISVGIAIGLKSKRKITVNYPRSSGKEPVVFIKERGVLMGEPVTKSILTLYSLVCEEAAIRDYLYQFSYTGITDSYEFEFIFRNADSSTTRYVVQKSTNLNWVVSAVRTLPRKRIIRIGIRNVGSSNFEEITLDWFNELIDDIANIPYTPASAESMFRGDYESQDTYMGPVSVRWRAFAVGGDDHIAYGPVDYLKLITSNHFAFGSKISMPKHGYSNHAVKYCEKVLLLAGHEFTPTWKVNKSLEDYENSVWVDSVKVRLLSPLTKSMDCENDRNTAIGKSGSMSRIFSWLPQSFSRDWVLMLRCRFAERMYPYLPSPAGRSATISASLMLPKQFGGLGLLLRGERLSDIIRNCTKPTRFFVKLSIRRYLGHDIVITDKEFERLTRAFSRVCTANSSRGIDKKTTTDWIEDFLLSRKSFTLNEARESLEIPNNVGNRRLYTELQNKGFYNIETAVEKFSRSAIFMKALRGQNPSSFATSSWRERFHNLWSLTEELCSVELSKFDDYELTIEEAETLDSIQSDVSVLFPEKLYNIYELTVERPTQNLVKPAQSRAKFFSMFDKIALQFSAKQGTGVLAGASKPLIEVFNKNTPCLTLRMDFLGNPVPHAKPYEFMSQAMPGDFEDIILDLQVSVPDSIRTEVVVIDDASE